MYGNYTISNECNNQNHVCEVDYNIESKDNFKENIFSIYNNTIIILFCIELISVNIIIPIIYDSIISSKKQEKAYFFKVSNMIYTVFLLSIFITVYNFYDIKETCSFARWCHEGINNNIVPSFYFYQMKECPKYSNWLVYYYLDESSTGTMKCHNSEYGCCEIRTAICEDSIENGNTFSTYQLSVNQGKSHWEVFESKIDEEGSNCPTIEDIIYKVSENDRLDYIGDYIIFTLIYFSVITIKFICKYKEITKYVQLETKAHVTMKESV